jgi:formaldehyde-activating enzyme involved in methanogenesis
LDRALVVCGLVLVAVVSRPMTHAVPSLGPDVTPYVEVAPRLIPIAAADREVVYKQMEEAWRAQAKAIRLAMTRHPEKRKAYERVLEVIEANLAAVRRHMLR